MSRVLGRFGVEPGPYWLLVDLFAQLSDRDEMLDQLGRDGVALKIMAWLYFAMSCLVSIFLLAGGHPTPAAYCAASLFVSSILLLSVLLMETGNSLVNPVEGLVLAHQPINGATYAAAKLTHLGRIILYLVPGLNAVPALAGLLLEKSGWYYPLLHLLAALAVAVVLSLLCCALFGWLIRFLPPKRLKAAGQLAGTLPLLAMIWWRPVKEFLVRSDIVSWWPEQAAAHWSLVAAICALAAATVVFGLRSLTADYLIRVSSLVRGGVAAGAKRRRSPIGRITARFFGGQPGCAGFAFVSRMMLRDWHFRRQLASLMIPALIGFATMFVKGWRTDPLSGTFTPIHLLPHILGAVLFFVCNFLPYGSDFKGAWMFELAPEQAMARFARGVYALLWIKGVVIPHFILLPLFIWSWGISHAVLFMAYSMAVVSIYLALNLRLIDGTPFSKQFDPSRGAAMFPLMIMGGIAMAVVAGVQYFLVFRSPMIVLLMTLVIGPAAYFLTRSSLGAFESAIHGDLTLSSMDSGSLFRAVKL